MDQQTRIVPAPLLRRDGTAVRVLVVDDEPDGAYVVSTVLRYQGWQVRSAPDGHAAVAVAGQFQPDALVMDVLLPDVDGLEVARRIRAARPDVLVLFLTASSRGSRNSSTRMSWALAGSTRPASPRPAFPHPWTDSSKSCAGC
jgi:CheY-like chemotaxis protein